MKTTITIFLVLITSVFTIIPLFHKGFFDFHDNTQVVRVYEMGKMLSSKMFPVRWVPDLGYGFGYPIFNFYGPLPYYIGGGFYNIGFDVLSATKIMFAIGILTASITMFFFSRKFFGVIGGIVSAILYAYFPYHAVNIYVRGAVDEFFAYAFLPLIFLGTFNMLKIKKWENASIPFLLVSIGVFLVAISHNLTFFMFLLLLIPIAITILFFTKSKKYFLITLITSVTVGILFSSFYILPAFFEMKYTNVASQIGGGADFRDHFVCLSQYWNSMWGYGGSIKGCMDGLSFKLGKGNILLVLITLLLVAFPIYKKKLRIQEKAVVISAISTVICLFLTLSISQIIWEQVPLMGYIQYPWRFINFIALFMSFVAGYIFFVFEKKYSLKIAGLVGAIAIIMTIVMNGKLFVPQDYNAHNSQFYTSSEYINFTVSKISDEYMPAGFLKPQQLSDLPQKEVELLKTEGSLSVVDQKPQELKISYNIPNDGVIHINKAFYPSWKVILNGEAVPIVPTANGMNVSIKKGEGVLNVVMKSTTLQIVANSISILAFLGLTAAIILLSRDKK